MFRRRGGGDAYSGAILPPPEKEISFFFHAMLSEKKPARHPCSTIFKHNAYNYNRVMLRLGGGKFFLHNLFMFAALTDGSVCSGSGYGPDQTFFRSLDSDKYSPLILFDFGSGNIRSSKFSDNQKGARM